MGALYEMIVAEVSRGNQQGGPTLVIIENLTSLMLGQESDLPIELELTETLNSLLEIQGVSMCLGITRDLLQDLEIKSAYREFKENRFDLVLQVDKN